MPNNLNDLINSYTYIIPKNIG